MSKKNIRRLLLLVLLIVAAGLGWQLMRPSAPAKPALAPSAVVPPTLEFLPQEVVTAAPV
jgi:hypothetical protein